MKKECQICKIQSGNLTMHMKKHSKDENSKEFNLKEPIESAKEKIAKDYIEPTQTPEQERVLNEPKEVPLTEQALNTQPEASEQKNVNNCTYFLTMNFNNGVFSCWTNDLKISMLSFKPQQLFTEGYIRIQKGNANFERKYDLVQLRKIFNDVEQLDLFINNLMLG